ncbi:hypothetical protein SRM1_03581 [Pseudomonas fluorescens]|nr:hypothetical protein SRM1_03581 [Pseudomonas fluorescens]
MPTDAITAMAKARANFGYLTEAQDEVHLLRLKNGASGYNQSLKLAGVISDDQLTQLSEELECAYQVSRLHIQST